MQKKAADNINETDSNSFRKIISSSGINFVFRIFGLASAFLINMIIPRLFGMDTLGNYSLVFTIAQASAMIFALGIPSALIKIVGNNSLNFLQAKKILIKGLKATLVFSILPILFFSVGSKYLSYEIFDNVNLVNYFLIVAISLPLFIFHEIFLYFFIATQKFKLYNLFMFVLPNVLLIIFLYLFFLFEMPDHYSFLAFAVSIFIVVAMEVVIIFELNPKKETSIVSSRELVKIASPLMFSSLMLFLLNWTCVIMLGIMMSEHDVAVYSIAYRVGSVGFLVIVSVNLITMPKMAKLHGEGNTEGLKKLVHQSTRLIAALSIPMVAGLIILSDFILSLFDEGAVEGKSTMIIVACGVLFSAICGNIDQILNMTGYEKQFRNIAMCCFFVNVALNYLLIPFYGINGAAMASLITNVVLNVVSLIYMRKKLGFYTFV